MSFYNIFINKPKFKFKEIISNKADCLADSFQYDCYKDKNGEVILIIAHLDIDNLIEAYHLILLINLNNNKVKKELEGHKDRVIIVRYFQNPYSKIDYLISADDKKNIIVWDLNDFCKIFEANMHNDAFIPKYFINF